MAKKATTSTRASKPAAKRAKTKKAAPPTPPTHVEISARAYAIYLERGGEHGSALEDWLQAERELADQE